MTEYLFVRHALPMSDVVDPGLSPEGQEQALRVARWLSAETIDAVVTSPLRRSVETADVIAAAVGLGQAVPLEELRELGAEGPTGSHYVPAEKLGAYPVGLALAEGRYEDVQPREHWDDFKHKATVCRDTLLQRFPEGRIAVVAHGGIINALLANFLGLDSVFWFYPGYTSISRVESLLSGRVVIRTLNEQPHLAVHGADRFTP